MRHRPSRLGLAAWLGVALSSPVQASAQCARPAEMVAFDIASLKSQLMVTALTCQAQDQYNAFVNRFRTDLVRSESALGGYFRRVFGGRAQGAHDGFITALANARSQIGLRAGDMFCATALPLFDDAMLARSAADLATLARLSGLARPVDLVECEERASRTVTAYAGSSSRAR